MELVLAILHVDDLARLGVTIPKPTADARAIFDAAQVAASLQPADTLRRALEAGEITPENVGDLLRSTALDHSAQQSAHALVLDLQFALNRQLHKGLLEAEAKIVTELRAVFAPAAAIVTAAAGHFGPETTAEQVIGMGEAAVESWNQLGAATKVLDKVFSAYLCQLREVTRTLPEQPVTLFVTGKGVLDLEHAAALYAKPRTRWLGLAHDGFTLRLNSTTEAAELVAKVQAARDKAEAVEKEARLAEHRRRHMPIGLGR